MRKKLLAMLMLTALTLVCCLSDCKAETGTVTATALVMRTGPGTEYERMRDIPQSASLVLLSYDASGWYRVGYDGSIGYVYGRYVRVTETRSTAKGEMPDVSALIEAGNNPSYPAVMKLGDIGNGVRDLQSTLAALGYSVTVDGCFGQDTELALKSLQKKLGLSADGIVGTNTRAAIGRSSDTVELLDWWKGGNTAFSRFSTAVVVDVETGLSFTVWRYGGDSHFDVEPFTSQDTATFKTIYGGAWSWDRRPVWLIVGDRVIAGSINGMPHDGYRISDNDFDGHVCIHLLSSRVHASDAPDEEHQAAVQAAYNARASYR